MGNYYEGNIFVKLKTIPNDLRTIIDEIKKAREEFTPYLLKGEKDVSSLYLDEGYCLYIPDNILKNEDKDIPEKFRYVNISKKNYDNTPKEILNKYEIRGYWISASVCKKHYNKELEFLLDFLKNYIDEDFNETIVGHIKDEDGYCDKDLYLNESIFEKLWKERDYLCSGCNNRREDSLCEHYEICKRAFKLGTKTK